MPKSSWSICVSGTIRVPTKRFCLPWFPRFDFFFHSTPSSPLENHSTTKLSDSPWNAWTPPERDRWSLRSLRCLDIDVDFFLSLPLSSFFFSREKKNSFTVERVPRITQLAANDGFIRLTGPWRGREIESAEAWQDQDFPSASLLNRITWVR